MKHLIVTFVFLMASSLTPAQSVPSAPQAAKAGGDKVRPKLATSAIKAVEERTPMDDDPSVVLTLDDLAVAGRIHVGRIPCELGVTVTITPSKREGFFVVQTRKENFQMHPVASRTGAIRLEDPKRGALWLQLGNKSMLMSQKLGARLADECMSPVQTVMADELKKNPARSLLETLDPVEAPLAAASPSPGDLQAVESK